MGVKRILKKVGIKAGTTVLREVGVLPPDNKRELVQVVEEGVYRALRRIEAEDAQAEGSQHD